MTAQYRVRKCELCGRVWTAGAGEWPVQQAFVVSDAAAAEALCPNCEYRRAELDERREAQRRADAARRREYAEAEWKRNEERERKRREDEADEADDGFGITLGLGVGGLLGGLLGGSGSSGGGFTGGGGSSGGGGASGSW